MKVGTLQFFSWPQRRVELQTVYERALQRVEIMDQSGYDAVWLAEHHFNSFSVCPSVHMMGTEVAARTEHLRIGTAVSLAAFYHPLRLAEEVALLDILSGGRVNWGAGRGFDPTEFRAFSVPREESYPRFRESVEIVLEAWRNDQVSYHGTYWHFDDVEVLPKPLQKPHPPVWMAASSPDAIQWAAEQGHSIMMDPHSTHSEIALKREFYRTHLEEAGHSFGGRELPMARLLAIAPSHGEAEEIARRGAAWTVGAYANPQRVRGPIGNWIQVDEKVDPVERYLNGVAIFGTPEEVVDQLQKLREEMFLDYLMCAPLSHGTFLLFTEKVLPKLR